MLTLDNIGIKTGQGIFLTLKIYNICQNSTFHISITLTFSYLLFLTSNQLSILLIIVTNLSLFAIASLIQIFIMSHLKSCSYFIVVLLHSNLSLHFNLFNWLLSD